MNMEYKELQGYLTAETWQMPLIMLFFVVENIRFENLYFWIVGIIHEHQGLAVHPLDISFITHTQLSTKNAPESDK